MEFFLVYLSQVKMLTGFLDFMDILPKRIRVDNGPEFDCHHFRKWAYKKNIFIEYIQPGSPYSKWFYRII